MPEIEDSAALLFRGSSQDAIADDASAPVEFYIPFQMDGLVLVADEAGGPVGFVACQACQDALHIWELAVRRDRQGRGIGRALVAGAVGLARQRGLATVTLSTFREIPWNAPFYARLGFVEVPQGALSPRLAAVCAREADLGLDVANRCAMRLTL